MSGAVLFLLLLLATLLVRARYRPESTVTVYYDPSRHSESVFIRGTWTEDYQALKWELFVTLVFILAVVGGISQHILR